MSNSVSNVEIEDVLASIRRLVSATPDAPEPMPAGSDKLVLTPAQRVVGGAGPDSPAETRAPVVRDDGPPPTLQTPPSFAQEPEPEPVPEEDTDEVATRAREDDTDVPQEVDAVDDMGEAMPWDDVEAPTAPSSRHLEDTIAELEAAVDEAAFTWEPEGDADPAEAETAAATPVVDFTSRRDFSPPPVAEAPAEPDLTADGAGNADDPALEDDLSEYFDDAASLDEEALRALVAEIVRQELQGTLGERITRNVRKLVRREIHRILASQDFD